jgi:hypothetical protein
MFSGDIKLDQDGNTVIENGDFVMTEDDSQFILHMLTTSPGSWLLHPELGVGLQTYIGNFTNVETIKKIRFSISDFFKRYGFFPDITLYYLDDETLICYLNFHILGDVQTTGVTFSFNMKNGGITFLTDADKVSEDVTLEVPKSKYLRRRS